MFTDGSRSVEGTGFEMFHAENFKFGLRLHEPSGVYVKTSEPTAIFQALSQRQSHLPGYFLFFHIV
jgi:hypothetical protein